MKPVPLLMSVLLPCAPAPAQELPPTADLSIAAPAGGDPLRYLVQLPPQHTSERWWPLLVLLPDGADAAAATDTMQQVGRDVAAGGFVVVVPVLAKGGERIGALLALMRRTHRIDQGGMHLAGFGDGIPRAIDAELEVLVLPRCALHAKAPRHLAPSQMLPQSSQLVS